ncbi:Man1-Src1p-C-terminal domain-containing protein [Schizophyllum amplum]|uniref:Man1-Src1p-C-terminal domain-containing protein n=1 Tax=Schizophyllum amplum TaxID=97359 RepID=A0A550C1N2_9AGAR|nr:Man1-Src1p-C-terminal domain-containing protein [Auriculariopsis ampla]
MSRLTTAQVIAQGHYLEPDFNPASLTVSQLLGVFGYHNVQYPTPYNKPTLVKLFNDEIKGKARKYKKERLKKDNSIASDDGITDGVTGRLLNGGQAAVQPRRSSRRISRQPTEEPEPLAALPEPPKRRRSSAQPTAAAPTRRAPVQPIVIEESEPEDEVEEAPPRKIGRRKKNADGSKRTSRRVSGNDDSGWEDHNIFQSGAESSSPVRPSPPRSKARKSSTSRKSRLSSSAPPESPTRPSPPVKMLSPSPIRAPLSPPSPIPMRMPSGPFTFASSSPGPSGPFHGRNDRDVEWEEGATGVSEVPELDLVPEDDDDDDEDRPFLGGEEYEDVEVPIKGEEDDEVEAVGQRISEGPRRKLEAPRLQDEEPTPASPMRRLFFTLAILALGYLSWGYKQESAQIGFCTSEQNGEPMNSYLQDLRVRRIEALECTVKDPDDPLAIPVRLSQVNMSMSPEKLEQLSNSTYCPPVPLLPVPDSCTPCPAHAVCSRDTVTCNEKFELKPNKFLFFAPPHAKVDLNGTTQPLDAWRLLDGLPGLGPVAFPPRCIDDGKWETLAMKHANRLGNMLRATRSERLCAGEYQEYAAKDGGEARQWGFSYDELASIFRKMTGNNNEKFNIKTMLDEALGRLSQYEVIMQSTDDSGQRYYAHMEDNLSWACLAKVSVRETWAYYRLYVFAATALAIFGWWKLFQHRTKTVETQRARELALQVLETLQNQELMHYTDPVRAPEEYVGSARLRDLLLQQEWNKSQRERVWKHVERLVEGNENVRANLAEEGGGDEMRVWRWVGSVGMTPMRPRKNSNIFAPEEDYEEQEQE